MNRIVVLGLAMFFAIVGIALLGGDSKAMAFGHRKCCSCSSCNGCNGGCHGCHSRCHGCHKRHRCHGCNGCNGCNGGSCCSNGGYVQAPEKQAPAPAQAPVK
jgi:hypothetical protein